jgi:hypothetical protein
MSVPLKEFNYREQAMDQAKPYQTNRMSLLGLLCEVVLRFGSTTSSKEWSTISSDSLPNNQFVGVTIGSTYHPFLSCPQNAASSLILSIASRNFSGSSYCGMCAEFSNQINLLPFGASSTS